MGVIQPTPDAYASALSQLVPPGRWNLEAATSKLYALLLANGDELARVSQRAAALIEESDPRTATEMPAEWEQMLELPSTGTDEDRRARIVSRLLSSLGARPLDFQTSIAPIFGLAIADVVVVERPRAFAITVEDDSAIFIFFLYRDPTLPGSYDIEAAQAQIELQQQSHTLGFAIESISFRCEDPFSLCDRDILQYGPHDFVLSETGIAPDILWPGRSVDVIAGKTLAASGTVQENQIVTDFIAKNWITERAFAFGGTATDTWAATDATICDLDGPALVCVLWRALDAAPGTSRTIVRKFTTGPLMGWDISTTAAGQVLMRLWSTGSTNTLVSPDVHSDGAWHMAAIVRRTDDTVFMGTDLSATASLVASGSSANTAPVTFFGNASIGPETALFWCSTDPAIDSLTAGGVDTLIANLMTAIVP